MVRSLSWLDMMKFLHQVLQLEMYLSESKDHMQLDSLPYNIIHGFCNDIVWMKFA